MLNSSKLASRSSYLFFNQYRINIGADGTVKKPGYVLDPSCSSPWTCDIDVASLSGGKFVVAWQDISGKLEDKCGSGILVPACLLAGRCWNPFVVNTQGYGDQTSPYIVTLQQVVMIGS